MLLLAKPEKRRALFKKFCLQVSQCEPLISAAEWCSYRMALCNTAVNPVLAPWAFKQLCPLTLKVTGLHPHSHTNIPSYLRGPIKSHIENSWAFPSVPSCVIYLWWPYCWALSEGVAAVFVLEEAQNNAFQAHFSYRASSFRGQREPGPA